MRILFLLFGSEAAFAATSQPWISNFCEPPIRIAAQSARQPKRGGERGSAMRGTQCFRTRTAPKRIAAHALHTKSIPRALRKVQRGSGTAQYAAIFCALSSNAMRYTKPIAPPLMPLKPLRYILRIAHAGNRRIPESGANSEQGKEWS